MTDRGSPPIAAAATITEGGLRRLVPAVGKDHDRSRALQPGEVHLDGTPFDCLTERRRPCAGAVDQPLLDQLGERLRSLQPLEQSLVCRSITDLERVELADHGRGP